jgi:DNA-binding Xre family transcriptional regulator
VIHRHVQVRPGTPAEELPSAAIVDLLGRGDLDDWQPIADAIARDPKGELAEKVVRLVDAYPMYGTSPLWRSWIDRRRARAEGDRRSSPVEGLASLRRELGLTQVELAGRVGMSQSDLSKLERRRDVRLSTLRAYTEALGGSLRILCELGGRQMEIRFPSQGNEEV